MTDEYEPDSPGPFPTAEDLAHIKPLETTRSEMGELLPAILGAPPEETADRLVTFQAEDDYGFCSGDEAIVTLDEAGLAAYENAIRKKWKSGKGHGMVDILKAICQKRDDVDGYAALCTEAGRLNQEDCETVAKMCVAVSRLQEALTWVERGLAMPDRFGHNLPSLRLNVLKQLGRGGEALELAWAAYERRPSTYSLEELEEHVPPSEAATWHARALAVAVTARLDDRIKLLLHLNELPRLAQVVEEAGHPALMGLSHYTTERAAEALEESFPLTAARLHAALGLRILESKKSKYYQAGLEHFEVCRELLLDGGKTREWSELAGLVRSQHGRKYGFMPGFERIDAGKSARQPTFLERARARRT